MVIGMKAQPEMHHRGRRRGRKSPAEVKSDRKKILPMLKRSEETEKSMAQKDLFKVKDRVEGYNVNSVKVKENNTWLG